MKRTHLAVLLGVTLLAGLACSIAQPTDCGNVLSLCSPIPPAATTAPAPTWPTGDVFAVTGIVEDGQPSDLADGLDATITVGEPVELDVYNGCNTLHVSGGLSGDRIAPVTVTVAQALPCPTRPSELGQWLTTFFEATPTWSVDGDRLTLATDHATVLGLRQ